MKCAICSASADFSIHLFDHYLRDGIIFDEQDFTCRWLCLAHAIENEKGAQHDDHTRVRSCVRYPFSKRNPTTGRTIYKVLKSASPEAHALAPLFPTRADPLIRKL